MAVKKKTKDTSILRRFDGTIVERPIEIAKKTFLASLSLANQFQNSLESNFEKLAKDGEKVRDDASRSVDKLRSGFVNRVDGVRNDLTQRLDSVLGTVLEYSPVATTKDVQDLNSKLDKALRVTT